MHYLYAVVLSYDWMEFQGCSQCIFQIRFPLQSAAIWLSCCCDFLIFGIQATQISI